MCHAQEPVARSLIFGGKTQKLISGNYADAGFGGFHLAPPSSATTAMASAMAILGQMKKYTYGRSKDSVFMPRVEKSKVCWTMSQ